MRAEAMQKATEEMPGCMMTVFLRPEAKIRFACHAAKLYCSKELEMVDPVCEVSNYLYPGCKVVAGNKEVNAIITAVDCFKIVYRAILIQFLKVFNSARLQNSEDEVLRTGRKGAPIMS